MITGLILGIGIALFISSLVVALAGVSNILQENIITGAAIGVGQITSYAILGVVVSFVIAVLILLIIIKPYKKF